MRIMTVFTFLAATLLLAFAAQGAEDWKKIENKIFSFSVPPSFKKTESKGIDSFAEEYVADGIEITFDYGMYSNNFANWPKETKFEELKIDGKPAKTGIVKKDFHSGFPYSTQVRFNLDGHKALAMFAACKTEEDLALARKIFESIVFK